VITFIIAAIAVALDQFSKYLAVSYLKPISDIPLWEGVFHLHYAENTGAAFSMMQGQILLFVLFTIITVGTITGIVIYYRVRQQKLHWTPVICMGMIMGGAIGNFIDRVSLGYVIDFFYFKLINFAIFNVADSCIVVGAVLLSVYLLFFYRDEKHPTEAVDDVDQT